MHPIANPIVFNCVQDKHTEWSMVLSRVITQSENIRHPKTLEMVQSVGHLLCKQEGRV